MTTNVEYTLTYDDGATGATQATLNTALNVAEALVNETVHFRASINGTVWGEIAYAPKASALAPKADGTPATSEDFGFIEKAVFRPDVPGRWHLNLHVDAFTTTRITLVVLPAEAAKHPLMIDGNECRQAPGHRFHADPLSTTPSQAGQHPRAARWRS